MASLRGGKKPKQENRNGLSEELLAELIHKLNNPLTAVLGYSEILLLKLTTPDFQEDVKKIMRETRRMSGILRELSDYIKKREPQKEVVDINELVRKTAEVKARELGLRNIEVSAVLTPSVGLVQGDPVQIQTVLFNLIENAEETLSEFRGCGKIRIETLAKGDSVEVVVTDDGPGIAGEHISKIFNPLFTTKKGKTGLGLSISDRIVRAHGGKIGVKAELGGGTSLTVTLPIISGLDEKEREKQIV
jgi:signal transduction histidine kinase